MATVVIALTGDPGAGKSTAAAWFASAGALVLDADAIVREMWDGDALPAAARARWGEKVFTPDGKIDKRAVSAIVFSDDSEYRWLCDATQPLVIDRMKAALPESGIVVAEIPMLFEAGRPDWVDRVLFMSAQECARADRNSFRGLDAEELARREKFFLPREERTSRSDWVLCNDGTREELADKLSAVLQQAHALLEKRENEERGDH